MFNKRQLELIKFGKDYNLDYNIYAKEYFDDQQMLILLNMLQDSMDAEKYAIREYNYELLKNIYLILREKLPKYLEDEKINLLIIEN